MNHLNRSIIPEELVKVVTAFLYQPVLFGADIDLVACTNNGYIIEFLNNHIVNSCCVSVTDATEVGIHFNYKDKEVNCFYIIYSASGSLVVLQRKNNSLRVIKKLEDVRSYCIVDWESRGMPELAVCDGASRSPRVVPVFDSPDEQQFQPKIYQNVNHSFAKCLPLEVQTIKCKLERLHNELLLKQKILRRHLEPDVTKDSLLVLKGTHQRVYADLWVTLYEVANTFDGDTDRLMVTARGSKMRQYRHQSTYRARLKLTYIIIVSELPDLTVEGGVKCQYELRLGECIKTAPEVQLTAANLLTSNLDLFSGHIANRMHIDLACVNATHMQWQQELRVTVPPSLSLEHMLVTELSLQKLTHITDASKDQLFRFRTHTFSSMLIALRQLDVAALRVSLYASDLEQLLLFVTALKQIVPYGTVMTDV